MTDQVRLEIESTRSRRSFMASSSFASLAAATMVVPRDVHARTDDTIKIGLIGCGNRGTGAATNALDVDQNVKLHAMGDAFSDRLESSRELLLSGKTPGRGQTASRTVGRVDVPPDRRFVGLQAYKQVVDACDVVILTGPPGFRPDHFEYAVQQGSMCL